MPVCAARDGTGGTGQAGRDRRDGTGGTGQARRLSYVWMGQAGRLSYASPPSRVRGWGMGG
ncbi:MAG: hypothetical protein KME26_25360 [Oscillatoria princeps RMCB-10]|nr:hypothetical protein [Oscillatoria princeps RMCB-10]